MRVGWLFDQGEAIGGAELTQAEFRAAAPDGVEVIDCPPDQIEDCDGGWRVKGQPARCLRINPHTVTVSV